MKKYLVLFKCAEGSDQHQRWQNLTSEEKAAVLISGNEHLEQWNRKYSKTVTENERRLGTKMFVADNQGLRELPSSAGSFFVLKASSLQDAASAFEGHPHFSVFPGDAIEIFEIQ